jgi:hypothetical protein
MGNKTCSRKLPATLFYLRNGGEVKRKKIKPQKHPPNFTRPKNCLFERDPNRHGLIYVLEGGGYLTSPEIALAIRMGADVTIRSGVVVPSAP